MDESLGLAPEMPAAESQPSYDFDAAFSGGPPTDQRGKRWLLKILAGPNSGAQMNLEEGKSYVIGSDGSDCDIVLTDLSVSKQHLRLTLKEEGALALVDLKSRNGVLVNGVKIDEETTQTASALVTLGSTTLMLVDRQAQQSAIIAPPIPIPERAPEQPPSAPTETSQASPEPVGSALVAGQMTSWGRNRWTLWASVISGALVFMLLALTLTLLRDRPLSLRSPIWEEQVLAGLFESDPLTFNYNSVDERVTLQGHVSNAAIRAEILEKIRSRLPHIEIDTHRLIVDDALCREFNQVLSKNWPEITLANPSPGEFVLQGTFDLQERLDKLEQYMAVQFPFRDQLKFDILAIDSTTEQVNRQLQEIAPGELVGQFRGSDLLIAGAVTSDKQVALDRYLVEARSLPGVQSVENLSVARLAGEDDQNAIDLTGRYSVSGLTKRANVDVAVMINGRIYQRGDLLDEMAITSIRPDAIILQRGETRFRIPYSNL